MSEEPQAIEPQAIEPQPRALALPWEGAEALRTALGILTDHDVAVDLLLLHGLDQRLAALWAGSDRAGGSDRPGGSDTAPEARERPFLLTIEEADLLLFALRYTDAMSIHLEFYDLVVDAIRFVGDALTDLWAPEQWMAWRDRVA